MARVEAVIAGTNVIPAYGRALLDEENLQQMAEQLMGSKVPMLAEHDLDQPIDAIVVKAEVRDGGDGERLLWVEYEVPKDQAAVFKAPMGMSVGFTHRLTGPKDADPDARLWVDPTHFDAHELAVALGRLNKAGFTPEGGAYFQLALEPPPAVVFEYLFVTAQTIGWNVVSSAIYDGLKVFLHREHKTRFRLVIHKTKDTVTAEVETSSEAGLKAALRALVELDAENDGLFVREARRWRRAGTAKRKRAGRKSSRGKGQ